MNPKAEELKERTKQFAIDVMALAKTFRIHQRDS